ncbi:MAG TPA: 2Fe-2S iron-sulfur cluster-binding protein [Acidobacteriota bacterium]
MTKLTIDGRAIEVEQGTRIIEAARQHGIYIPRYCYHPGLSIAGNCRMCLVEVEKAPKLMIACQTVCNDGMVVHTKSEKTKTAQAAILEFLLINHPLDCPVCDQAGECDLQNFYLDFGRYTPTFAEPKVKKRKAYPIGAHVILDSERCVLCSRCVRFCEEITQTHELGIFDRGDHAELMLAPGKTLDNNYSANTIDICPVGALTDRQFRFQVRVWYLRAFRSVCPGCSRGCNIDIHTNPNRPHHADGQRLVRIKPRFNPEVNRWWMCDYGRYSQGWVDAAERLALPLRAQGGAQQPCEWSEAIAAAAELLRGAAGQIGVIASAKESNEDLFLAGKLLREHLGAKGATVGGFDPQAPHDQLLLQADKAPNRAGAVALGWDASAGAERKLLERAARGEIKLLYVVGRDLAAELGKEPVDVALSKAALIYQGPLANPTSARAQVVLPSAAFAERDGSFTNSAKRAQLFLEAFPPLGEAKADWEIFQLLAKELGESWDYRSAQEVFVELAKTAPEFAGMTHEILGQHGALLASARGGAALPEPDPSALDRSGKIPTAPWGSR